MHIFIHLNNKLNTMHLNYARKVCFQVQCTNVDAQKNNNSKLNTFGIVIVIFLMEDKEGRF